MVHRLRFPTLLALAVALIVLGIVSSGGAADAAGSARTDVIIGFKGQPGAAEQALVRQAGGTIKYTYHLVPAIAASVPEAAIDGLQANPNVTSVDLDGEVHAIDAELDNAWGVKRIGAGTVHASDNKGTGVKVAVIDSGVDYNHPDLNANFGAVKGKDFVNGDDDPMDDRGHGTHVAGTIAAEDDDAGVVGVAPEASLYALKVLNASGSGSWSDVIAAVEWAVDPVNGIQVTNNSYGSSFYPGDPVQAAFDNSAAAGVLHVASAGNSGNPGGGGDNVGYPARFKSVIAVAATDSNDNRASFSSTGDAVELAAPGVAVNSTVPKPPEDGDGCALCDDSGYKLLNGTSMASPHVAGTGALVIAAGITDANGDGNINDEVRERLDETADALGDPPIPNSQYGYGLVDADEAADIGPPPPATPGITVTPTSGLITTEAGGTDTFTVVLDTFPSADVTIGLSSSDPTEGTVSLTSLTFTSVNGTTEQTVTVTGVEDLLVDGDIAYTIVTAAAVSADLDYHGIDPDNVSVTNIDNDAPPPGTVSVSSITYTTEGGKDKNKHLNITVALVDDLNDPVSGASVSIILENTTDEESWVGTGTTGESGAVTFSLRNAPSGTYTTTVTAVSAAGLTWDGVTPSNSFTK